MEADYEKCHLIEIKGDNDTENTIHNRSLDNELITKTKKLRYISVVYVLIRERCVMCPHEIILTRQIFYLLVVIICLFFSLSFVYYLRLYPWHQRWSLSSPVFHAQPSWRLCLKTLLKFFLF